MKGGNPNKEESTMNNSDKMEMIDKVRDILSDLTQYTEMTEPNATKSIASLKEASHQCR